ACRGFVRSADRDLARKLHPSAAGDAGRPVGSVTGRVGVALLPVCSNPNKEQESKRSMDILRAIGNTSMVRLRKVVPSGCADIFVKLEWENPTGSVKDRMAQAVIARAEADGRLRPSDTVVEYTGGSTGASLALICGAKGYRVHIVTSDAF